MEFRFSKIFKVLFRAFSVEARWCPLYDFMHLKGLIIQTVYCFVNSVAHFEKFDYRLFFSLFTFWKLLKKSLEFLQSSLSFNANNSNYGREVSFQRFPSKWRSKSIPMSTTLESPEISLNDFSTKLKAKMTLIIHPASILMYKNAFFRRIVFFTFI